MCIYTKGLNDNQKKAVETVDGTVQICSVAGSGKTRVLVNRTSYMIIEKNIDPQKILLTTFTNKATNEMKERLEKMLTASQLNDLTLGTSHSIGLSILKENKELTDYKKALADLRNGLLQGWKQTKLVKDIIKEMENKYKYSGDMSLAISQIKAPQFLKAVANFKNDNISPNESWAYGDNNNAKVQLYKEFYNMYEYQKQREQMIDFDDMLFLAVRLLKENPTVLKKYQLKWEYLMVDEAQDNNLLQYQLIKMLAYPQYNLFVVGDDDQSMYRFRGASPESFIHFNNAYNSVNQIPLTLNYRSHEEILERANKLIHFNKDRIAKKLVSASNVSEKSVFYNIYDDEDQEAEEVVQEILNLTENDGYKHSDIACLFRTNAQSRAIEDQLLIKGIPYKLHGGTSFYERSEIKDLIAYLKLAYNTNDNESFKRIYNKPNRYLGNAFYDKVSANKKSSHYDNMVKSVNSFYKNQQTGINNIIKIISNMKNMINKGKKLDQVLYYVLESGYKDWLIGEDFNSENDNPKLENIATLEYLLTHFETLEDFMKHLDKVMLNKKESENSVQLMTIHKSKGLEFKSVFVLGVSDGILPHFKALEEDTENKAIEEERRLCYVAVTRAEKRCNVSSIVHYNGKHVGESQFIQEMELEAENVTKSEQSA